MDEFRNSSESMSETDDRREVINQKLRQYCARRVVRKDLTKSIREGANSYTAKFVIENERIYVENANRALGDGFITEDNLVPISADKMPIKCQ